jgi:hypothetical protein
MMAIIRNRLSVVVALTILASLVGVASAIAAAPKFLRIDVQPAVVVDDTSTVFTVTATNLQTTTLLGGVEITFPDGFTVTAADNLVTPPGKNWDVIYPVPGRSANMVRLVAETQGDRIGFEQAVSVDITATTPDINSEVNDVDIIADITASGRQSNQFNSGGNEFSQSFETRDDTFVYRSGDGLTSSSSLLTNQILIVSGTASDCTVDCSGTDTQGLVTVNISVPGCDAGTLVVDATDLFLGDDPVNIAAFYHYLDGVSGCLGLPVVVEITYDSSLGVTPGGLDYVAYYGVDISQYDPDYVGDGNILPSCSGSVSLNCVDSVTGSSAGTVATIIGVLVDTDPAFGFA